ncbi:MAG: NAD-dependent epimerase/dehydratase family protein [Desulfuromonadaceae bacterium]|nr:NAD-dependent epimerase/dehydratase family protein [Desulfuromonadaceae bacterium]
MKILITGICGFVGSTLAKAWLEAEPELTIYGLDNFIRPGSEVNRIPLQKKGIKLLHGDIRVASDFDAVPAVDWVIDAAANPSVLAGVDGQISSRQLIEHNIQGTVNILEYCKRYGAGFILLSTSRVYSIKPLADLAVKTVGSAFRLSLDQPLPYGLSEAGISEVFTTLPPISLYGSTKLASEILALEYGETFDFPVWINRCGVLAGAGQFGRADQGIFAYWINAWLRRRPLTYIGFDGKGHQVRDCLHPRDLLPLLMRQTSSGAVAPIRLINLGGGLSHAISIAELSSWCTDRFGKRSVAGNPEMRRFDVPWMVMDASKAQDIWGWEPQTSIHEILDEIATHAEKHPNWLELSGFI